MNSWKSLSFGLQLERFCIIIISDSRLEAKQRSPPAQAKEQ